MNPYKIDGPALISFSGGRTSAYMLKQIIDAHNGAIPNDVHVVFANTGLEREETLRFVHECGSRWNVRIHWLEWRDREGRNTPAGDRFHEVGLNSASRKGEPFRALIQRKKYLPNAVTRFCTAELKIDTMKQFMLARGYKNWSNVVGLRFDEMRRVAKQQKRNDEGKERWTSSMPLVQARVTSRDVWKFWLGSNIDPKDLSQPLPQGFDLGLWPYEGNCSYCFLKGRDVLTFQERERPGSINDWIELEDLASSLTDNPNGARFVTEYPYSELQQDVKTQPLLIPIDPMHLEAEGECGVGGVDTRIRCGSRDRY